MDPQQRLNKLILDRAKLVSQLHELHNPSDAFFIKLGKTEANICILKKQQLSEVKDIFHED